MDKIAKRLEAYIEIHPFDSGDSNCATVLDQLYQAYAESHESDPPEIRAGFAELETFLESCLWTIITQSSTSAAASPQNTNVKHSKRACKSDAICLENFTNKNEAPAQLST